MNRAQAIVDSLLGEAQPWERDHFGELQRRIARRKALHTSSGKGEAGREKAKEYFGSPDRYEFPKMTEYSVGKVTPAPEAPLKPQEPPLTIKGRQKWMPKHYAMPAPWTKWR